MSNNYTKIKFSKKLNKYTYFYKACWRTLDGIKFLKKNKAKWDTQYCSTELGYFSEIWNTMKKSCNKNSHRIKVQKRKLKINNGIEGRDHLLKIWEKQKERLGGPYCAYTGVELTTKRQKGFGRCKATPTNISLDRIDSSLPYQEDNIVFCSWEFNNRKGAVTINDCELILKTWKEKQHEHG